MTTGSLAYRKHADQIQHGQVPSKYERVLPFIASAGRHVLEIGSAEGVLSLLMASRDPSARVTGLELRTERHQAALELQMRWMAIGRHVEWCSLICGNIADRLDLLEGVNTLVAVRTLYHLRDDVDRVLAAAAQHVSQVVLVGNPNRAKRYLAANGSPDDTLGAFNVYAGVEGMRLALERAGFTIGQIVTEGDPIVTGHR